MENVRVNASMYVKTNEEFPRGHGTWVYMIGEQEYPFTGYFADSTAKAVAMAKEIGVAKIDLLP